MPGETAERQCGWCEGRILGATAVACDTCGAPLPNASETAPVALLSVLRTPDAEPPPPAPRAVDAPEGWWTGGTVLAVLLSWTLVVPVLYVIARTQTIGRSRLFAEAGRLGIP